MFQRYRDFDAAAYLAKGEGLLPSVRKAKEFVTEAIRHAIAIGRGIGPVSPGWRQIESG